MSTLIVSPITQFPKKLKIPLFETRVSAGFPSPAVVFYEKAIDLNELLISYAAATFFVRVKGTSMIDAGIREGDVLIVDRSINPENNHIVIAMLDGEFTVKRLKQRNGKTFLEPANKECSSIEIKESQELIVWGVVTYVIHSCIR